MTIVYALGQPRFFDFATASSTKMLPPQAIVLAVCDGAKTKEMLDDYTFERMSDEEYCELQGLIRDSQERERALSARCRTISVYDSSASFR